MNEFSPFPDQAEAERELDPMLPVIWEALESSTTAAATFFPEHERVDPFLFPNLVRYYAKHFLTSRHISATEDEASVDLSEQSCEDFRQLTLSNNGLCVIRGRYAIRIRKSDSGQLPVPGKSIALQQFYRQQPLPFNLVDRPAQIVDTSLLLLWDVDLKYHFSGLTLVCPRDGKTTRASVDYFWQVPLANPTITLPVRRPVGVIEELEEIRAIDFPAQSQQPG